VESVLAEIVDTAEVATSEAIHDALFDIGLLAHDEIGSLRESREAWERVARHRERTLPEDHPDLLLARGNLAISMHEMGDLAGGT
jgi:hypothetical protein